MLFRLIVLLITVPLLETTFLLLLADRLGFPATFAIVVATGVLGAVLLKRQGVRAARRILGELADHRLPGGELLDGMLVVVAAVLLMTPGVATDLMGIVLLIPKARSLVRAWLISWFRSRWRLTVRGTSDGGAFSRDGDSRVIDSHVVRSEDDVRRME